MTLGGGARDHRLDTRVEPGDVAATGEDTDLHGAKAYDARAARPQVASARGAARRLGPASPRLAGADLPRLARVAGRGRRDLLALRDRPAVPEPRPAVATLRISPRRAPCRPRRAAPPAPRPARRSPPASR